MKQREITAAIYCRLSRDDGGDAESNSIGTQRDILTRYAKEHGFILYDEYVDDGWSGTNFERPQLLRLRSDIEEGKIGVLLCKDLSRIGRNNALTAVFTEVFLIENNVRLICLNDGIDTAVGENEIMGFKSILNEYYARDCSRKVRSARQNMGVKGQYAGSFAPYGYKKDPADKHHLIIDEETAPIVRKMYEMAADGSNVNQIAIYLAERHVYVPNAYKSLKLGDKAIHYDPEFPYNWQNSTVKNILLNRVNIGEMVNHKQTSKSFKNQKLVRLPKEEWITVKDTHEPLVSVDLFERAVALISVKKRRNTLNDENIFAGLLVCADCGHRLGFMKSATKTQPAWHYVCSRYRHAGKLRDTHRTCTMHYIPHKGLFAEVLARLQAIIAANMTMEDVLARIPDKHEPSKAAQKQLAALKRRDGELKLLIKRIVEREAFGEITGETFAELYRGYLDERDANVKKMESLEAELSAENRDKENAERFLEIVQKYAVPTELTRELLLDFVEKIVVHEATGNSRYGTREQELDIYYRFIGKLQGFEGSQKN